MTVFTAPTGLLRELSPQVKLEDSAPSLERIFKDLD